MKWVKRGLFFKPSGKFNWNKAYAQVPRTLEYNNFLRIYYATRPYPNKDNMQLSRTAYIDVDKKNINKILEIGDKPVFDVGKLGSFDEFGVQGTAFLKHNENKIIMFYTGWTRLFSVPYSTNIGIAVSKDGGLTFTRKGRGGPVLSANVNEPFFNNGPGSVLKIKDKYHMWYSSGIKWIINVEGKPESVYQIFHATSKDLENWNREIHPCIHAKIKDECQNSSSVIKINNTYHMWFCYRHALNFRGPDNSYRIGHAYSDDLINWKRDDSTAGIDVSESGWDCEMICYPHVFELDGKIYMLYCGNDFGKEGFGYAELEI